MPLGEVGAHLENVIDNAEEENKRDFESATQSALKEETSAMGTT